MLVIPLYIMVCMDVWSKILSILVYLTAGKRRDKPFTFTTVTHASHGTKPDVTTVRHRLASARTMLALTPTHRSSR